MNNFNKTESDVYSTMNNLESMIKEGAVSKDEIQMASSHLTSLKDMHKWIKSKEESYSEIEKYVDDLSHKNWLANRKKLNIIDIPSSATDEVRYRTNIINTARRMQKTVKVRCPLTELKVVPYDGYYNSIQVLVEGELVWELTITYPPEPCTEVSIMTNDNSHSPSEIRYQLHADLNKYVTLLFNELNILGLMRSGAYQTLDNCVIKIKEIFETV